MSARIDKTRNPRSRYVAARRVKPMLDGLGALPLDYVFAGANLVYNATVPSNKGVLDQPLWEGSMDAMTALAARHFKIQQKAFNYPSRSVFLNITVPGDFSSIQHVRQLLDGIINEKGYGVQASMIRFITNPRRDGQTQPPVNTPGVPPPHTALPPAAGNVDTRQPGGVLQTALDTYFGGLASKLGLSSTTLLILAGLGLVLIIKR